MRPPRPAPRTAQRRPAGRVGQHHRVRPRRPTGAPPRPTRPAPPRPARTPAPTTNRAAPNPRRPGASGWARTGPGPAARARTASDRRPAGPPGSRYTADGSSGEPSNSRGRAGAPSTAHHRHRVRRAEIDAHRPHGRHPIVGYGPAYSVACTRTLTRPRRSPSPTGAAPPTVTRTPPRRSPVRSTLGYRYVETDVHGTARRRRGRLPRLRPAPADRPAGPDPRPDDQGPGHGTRRGRGRRTPAGRCPGRVAAGALQHRRQGVAGHRPDRADRPRRQGRRPGPAGELHRPPAGPGPRALAGPEVATSLGMRGVTRLWLASPAATERSRMHPSVVAAQVPVALRPAHRRRPALRRVRAPARSAGSCLDDRRPGPMHHLLDLGVDGIMTDRVDVLRDVYTARGLWPA